MTVPLSSPTASRGCSQAQPRSTPLACGPSHRFHLATNPRCQHSGGQKDAEMRPLIIALAAAALTSGACSTRQGQPVRVAAISAVGHHHDVPEPATTTTVSPTTTTVPKAPLVTWPKAPQPQRLQGGPVDWARLRQCENGGSYTGTSNGFYGAYQFDQSTWAAQQRKHPEIGSWGSASPSQQDAAAQYLYGERGRAPWPVCGRR